MNNNKIKLNSEIIYNICCFSDAHVILFWFQVQTFLYLFLSYFRLSNKVFIQKKEKRKKQKLKISPFQLQNTAQPVIS